MYLIMFEMFKKNNVIFEIVVKFLTYKTFNGEKITECTFKQSYLRYVQTLFGS